MEEMNTFGLLRLVKPEEECNIIIEACECVFLSLLHHHHGHVE